MMLSCRKKLSFDKELNDFMNILFWFDHDLKSIYKYFYGFHAHFHSQPWLNFTPKVRFSGRVKCYWVYPV